MLYEKRGKVFKDEEKSAVRIHETAAASIPIRLQIRCLAKKDSLFSAEQGIAASC